MLSNNTFDLDFLLIIIVYVQSKQQEDYTVSGKLINIGTTISLDILISENILSYTTDW